MTEHEELLLLRALAEKQKEELAAKERIIEKQNIQIENLIPAFQDNRVYVPKYLQDFHKR